MNLLQGNYLKFRNTLIYLRSIKSEAAAVLIEKARIYEDCDARHQSGKNTKIKIKYRIFLTILFFI